LQTLENINNLLIGDIVRNASIAQFNDPDNIITVASIDRSNGTITLSENLDALITAGTEFTFKFQIGKIDSGYVVVSLGSLTEYEPYKIRMRYWFPDEPLISSNMERTLDINISFPDSNNDDNFNYKFLYSEDYNINPIPGTADYGDFNNFYDNRILVSGGVVGGIDQYDLYQSVNTLNALNISYTPPVSYEAIKKSVKNATYVFGRNYINLGITDPIEIGNYVFGAGLSTGTIVSNIAINNSVKINNTIISSQTDDTLTFINHRGIAAIDAGASWSNGGSTISGLSTTTTSKLRVNDVVVLNGSPSYNLIASINATSIATTKAFTASSSTGVDGVAFFYRSSGLYNGSLETYCANVYSKTTTAPSNAGSNIITIDSDTNIVFGQVVQFGSIIPIITTVVDIVPNGADFDITLSNNITDDITSGQIITFAPAGTTDSREICFPKLDTSPPFQSTLLGLQTTGSRPSMTLAPTTGELSKVKFVGLSADNVIVETAAITDSYNRTLTITDGLGKTYNILCITA
jgi:hypothetical protein